MRHALVGKEFRVLDKGFVQLIDYMGSDKRICEAARVSYGKGTTSVSDDEHLIRYMMRHHHTSPFEQCEIVFRVKVPMDTWRQWIRHRTANINEYSTRYSEAIDDKQETHYWRSQSTINKQGSSEHLNAYIGGELSRAELEFHKQAQALYKQRLNKGVAREQARKDLPLSTYTIAYWKMDLHNLLHFLQLRMDSHAQLEIRSYAKIIGEEIVAQLFPITWRAFTDYKLRAMTLSFRDLFLISWIHSDANKKLPDTNFFNWFTTDNEGNLKSNRERTEFENKAYRLGITIPWREYLCV